MKPIDRVRYHHLLSMLFLILGIGTVFYHVVEKFSWIDAVYFSVVTLATVGYGDLVPTTNLGKMFTTGFILIGAGVLTTFFTVVVRRQGSRVEKRVKARRQRKTKRA